jgi:hypothetical protein
MYPFFWGQGGVVGIATSTGWLVWHFIPSGGVRFSAPIQASPKANKASCKLNLIHTSYLISVVYFIYFYLMFSLLPGGHTLAAR